jgi:Short C-terminal domain
MSRVRCALGALTGSLGLVLLTQGASRADDGSFLAPDSGGGVPGWFVAFFVLVIVLGVGTTVWRVATAQKLAKRSGMDPSLATKMTLLSDDGLDATYLAASLRDRAAPPSPGTAPPTTAARLEELRGLLDRGLITQQEHDERRKAIIDSV